jgi:hypothetical protein
MSRLKLFKLWATQVALGAGFGYLLGRLLMAWFDSSY